MQLGSVRCWLWRDAAEAKSGTQGALPGEARGIAHQLAENFGALDRATLRHALPEKLGPQIRALRPFGVWFGRRTVYLPRLLRPDAAALLSLLVGRMDEKGAPPAPPAPGLTSFALDKGTDTASLHAAGFAVLVAPRHPLRHAGTAGGRIGAGARDSGTDAETLFTKLVSLLGSGKEEARAVLGALGWRAVEVAGAKPVWRRTREKPESRRRERPHKPEPPPDPNSPFAGLAVLRSR